MGIMNGKSFAHLDLTIALDIVYKQYNGTMLIIIFFQLLVCFGGC